MAKISTYATTTPTTSDLILGTDVGSSDATKNFTVSSILDLQDNLTIEEEGAAVATDCTSIDVVGNGATATAVGKAVTLTVLGVLPLVNDAGANRDLVIGDANTYLRFSVATNVDIPLNSSVAFPIGTEINIRFVPNGRVNVAGGVTLNYHSPTAAIACTCNAKDNIYIKKVATDEWDAWGNII